MVATDNFEKCITCLSVVLEKWRKITPSKCSLFVQVEECSSQSQWLFLFWEMSCAGAIKMFSFYSLLCSIFFNIHILGANFPGVEPIYGQSCRMRHFHLIGHRCISFLLCSDIATIRLQCYGFPFLLSNSCPSAAGSAWTCSAM